MQDVIRMTYDVALCHPDEIIKIWSLSHPDDLAISSISSGWLIVDALCHPDDLPGVGISSGWVTANSLCHPYDILFHLCHPDDLPDVGISSGWVTANSLCHPDDILFHLCHPDDLPDVGISSGWVTANSLCHPDDILFHFMSSGWLNWGWFLIRMSYGNVIMSSGWDTLPFLSHPDEIANLDFSQHAVALQRFCMILIGVRALAGTAAISCTLAWRGTAFQYLVGRLVLGSRDLGPVRLGVK